MDLKRCYRNWVTKRLSQSDRKNVDIRTRELFPTKYKHLTDKKMRRNKDLEHFLVKSIQPAPAPNHPMRGYPVGGREEVRAGAA